jgi:acyl-coenzyme A thioesterase PaaI-like protein
MKKLINPFQNIKGFNCFGCSENNKYGLKMSFFEDNDEIVSIWHPCDYYQGYNSILHGGIQATLMDEIASWVVFIKLKTGGVTSSMEVKLKCPVYTDKGKITLRAKLLHKNLKIAKIAVKLYNQDNVECSQSLVNYFVYSKKKAKEVLKYPGYEAFFE